MKFVNRIEVFYKIGIEVYGRNVIMDIYNTNLIPLYRVWKPERINKNGKNNNPAKPTPKTET